MGAKGIRHNTACFYCGKGIPRRANGRYLSCDDCKGKLKKHRYLVRTYGITIFQWDELFEKQGGRCALCGRHSVLGLAVDHSHKTGTVRGLLCMTCNRDIMGNIDKDEAHLKHAIVYLQGALDDLLANERENNNGAG